ncbi:hypothetical protein, partial [Rhizobium leguminosarum]|uniref:hypothetical protein n=1 Tax=Rhizobium leguminosarum TaxID=384 RepID=UPI003F9A0C5D
GREAAARSEPWRYAVKWRLYGITVVLKRLLNPVNPRKCFNADGHGFRSLNGDLHVFTGGEFFDVLSLVRLRTETLDYGTLLG